MKLSKRRILSLLLAVVTLAGCLLPVMLPLTAEATDYPNTYSITGNQRRDLINVGLTQIGFTEGPNNRTKYGSWYSTPNQPWCATFVSWCIAQAQLGKEARISCPHPGRGTPAPAKRRAALPVCTRPAPSAGVRGQEASARALPLPAWPSCPLPPVLV